MAGDAITIVQDVQREANEASPQAEEGDDPRDAHAAALKHHAAAARRHAEAAEAAAPVSQEADEARVEAESAMVRAADAVAARYSNWIGR